jgi:hypothetical protein
VASGTIRSNQTALTAKTLNFITLRSSTVVVNAGEDIEHGFLKEA